MQYIPEVVGIVIEKEGMTPILKDIYLRRDIILYFRAFSWKKENFPKIQITKENLKNISMDREYLLHLKDILDRDFELFLIGLHETNEEKLQKLNPDNIALEILSSYKVRTQEKDIIEYSENISID